MMQDSFSSRISFCWVRPFGALQRRVLGWAISLLGQVAARVPAFFI
jgi:hypothetical protein